MTLSRALSTTALRASALVVVACAAGLAGLLAAGCAAEPAETADPVVASGNGVEVRQSAFADEYRRYASLAPVRDGLAARRAYARQMLERAYIAAAADSAGLGALPDVRAHVERRRRFAARRAFLRDSLESRVAEPTEADVERAFRASNTRLHLRQAYAATEAEARALHRRVTRGEPFADVARASMQAAGLDGATGDMGWTTFNDLDEAPEAAVFALGPGEVSAPVASLNGWHVFEVLAREERARIDATAYASARERLAFDVRQRRVDEAGVRFLRPLLEGHALVIRMEPLRALWPQIAPLVPERGDAAVLAEGRERLPALEPEGLTRATPVATVDGRPFTVGQLLDEMPDIAVEFWTPDLRRAVEVAVRDSVLTARARAAGFGEAPEVQREAETARRTALYYAGLRAAADTLRVEAHVGRFYRFWQDAFVQARTTTFSVFAFATEAAAQAALASATAGGRPAALAAAPESRTDTAAPGTPGPFGVHTLPLSVAGRRALVGPFPEAGRFVVVEATRRTDAPVPFADARADVLAMMEAEPRAVVHRLLLDAGFRASAVAFDDAALAAALPLESPSTPRPIRPASA